MTELNVSVNFACQRCLQPLKLDESFNRIEGDTLAELSREHSFDFLVIVLIFVNLQSLARKS